MIEYRLTNTDDHTTAAISSTKLQIRLTSAHFTVHWAWQCSQLSVSESSSEVSILWLARGLDWEFWEDGECCRRLCDLTRSSLQDRTIMLRYALLCYAMLCYTQMCCASLCCVPLGDTLLRAVQATNTTLICIPVKKLLVHKHLEPRATSIISHAHPDNLNPSTSPGQPHPVNLFPTTSPCQPLPVNLSPTTSPRQPHPVNLKKQVWLGAWAAFLRGQLLTTTSSSA